MLEVPDSLKVPAQYEMLGNRKGFKRYTSPKLKRLVTCLGEAQEQQEAAVSNILQVRAAGEGCDCVQYPAGGGR